MLLADFAAIGPEALEISREDFTARLRPFRSEIKSILTPGDFVAGVGNAYADEMLWAARLHPYRRRTSLTVQHLALIRRERHPAHVLRAERRSRRLTEA